MNYDIMKNGVSLHHSIYFLLTKSLGFVIENSLHLLDLILRVFRKRDVSVSSAFVGAFSSRPDFDDETAVISSSCCGDFG